MGEREWGIVGDNGEERESTVPISFVQYQYLDSAQRERGCIMQVIHQSSRCRYDNVRILTQHGYLTLTFKPT